MVFKRIAILLTLICPIFLSGNLTGQDHIVSDTLIQDTLNISEHIHEVIHHNAVAESEVGQRFIDVFEKSPVFVIVLYIVIIYSIITLISLTIIILIKRSRIKSDEDLTQELNEKYQQLLIDYLFAEGEDEDVYYSIKKIASNDFKRQILINQLIELSASIQGDIKEKVRDLYLKLGLKEDSLRKAYSKKWHKNIKGFRELAFMNIRDANDVIIESLNSHNEILRMEAQISLVRLSDDNPYSFLDHLEKPLAIWEQITLHELVVQHGLNTPDFSQWFNSRNLSIVIFSLQMVSWFKQKQAVQGVIKLLEHEDEDVRHQAIRVCGDLRLEESLSYLEKIYDNESYRNRMEILNSFSRTPLDEYLEFLNGVLDKEEDVQLQITAAKAMENMGETGISRLIKLMKRKSEFKNYQIIIRHVLDGRIY